MIISNKILGKQTLEAFPHYGEKQKIPFGCEYFPKYHP